MNAEEYFKIFYDWLDFEHDGFVLRNDAPEEVKKAFDEFVQEREKAKEKGILID